MPAADSTSGKKRARRNGRSGPRTAPHAETRTHAESHAATATPAENSETVPEPSAPEPAFTTFAESPLPERLVTALADQGVDKPFPIQAATLPDALAGSDILGRARTGSGKTLAFGLALLARNGKKAAAPTRPRAIVLVPTRELAQQVTAALAPYGRAMKVRFATVVGGTSIGRQIQELRRGAEIVVATPGRLTDLIERGACQLSDVRGTVVDEADLMADMGFLPQISTLLDQIPDGGQRMLFSATLDGDVDQLVRRYLTEPVEHSVDPPGSTVSTMSHHLLRVSQDNKPAVVAEIAARDGRALLFVRTKRNADQLAARLAREGVRADALHGDKTQASRSRTLKRFRDGHVNALVATDVAARGIDVEGVDLVVNIDPPGEPKEYLHRGGRTARAGQSGKVVTMILPQERRKVQRLMTAAGINPEFLDVRPGDAELIRVTGAQEPSGVAVSIEPPERPGGSRSQGKQGRQQGKPAGPRSSGRPDRQGRPDNRPQRGKRPPQSKAGRPLA